MCCLDHSWLPATPCPRRHDHPDGGGGGEGRGLGERVTRAEHLPPSPKDSTTTTRHSDNHHRHDLPKKGAGYKDRLVGRKRLRGNEKVE